jgi:hypothetical protein
LEEKVPEVQRGEAFRLRFGLGFFGASAAAGVVAFSVSTGGATRSTAGVLALP